MCATYKIDLTLVTFIVVLSSTANSSHLFWKVPQQTFYFFSWGTLVKTGKTQRRLLPRSLLFFIILSIFPWSQITWFRTFSVIISQSAQISTALLQFDILPPTQAAHREFSPTLQHLDMSVAKQHSQDSFHILGSYFLASGLYHLYSFKYITFQHQRWW